MISNLTNRQLQIIEDLYLAKNSAKDDLTARARSGALSASDIDTLREILLKEFLMQGIKENFEPNDYGLELEILREKLNREKIFGSDL
jgi:hypothetical protein